MLTESLLMADAAVVCKNAPPMPFSMAAVAVLVAAMLVASSLDSLANAAACFVRSAVALATAALASARSDWAVLRSAFNCCKVAAVSLMLLASCSLLLEAEAIEPDRLPSPVTVAHEFIEED